MEPGILYLVATPIGNLADITLRALETLRGVDLIAAEDTRHSRKLLSHYDIHRPMVSYHAHNLKQRGPELLDKLQSGASIALVSDAGTPGISDPGELLVAEALARDIPVVALPGPAAFLTALAASGLSPQPFAFLGFPPSRGTARKEFFSRHGTLELTVVLYESPKRLLRTLSDILEQWGDRKIAVARELTKKYEEIFRGSTSEALERFASGARGEFTLVVAGAMSDSAPEAHDPDWRLELAELLRQPQFTLKTAADAMAKRYRLARRMVYQEALKIKDSQS